jgi:protein-S-isoprenylcysteine O-methyltransferase Ste14
LGVESIPTNPLGWFLLLVSVAYIAGVVIMVVIRKERFWESSSAGIRTHEEHGDLSFWFISLGLMATFFLSPLVYLFHSAILSRNTWISFTGVGLVTAGAVLLIWARRSLKRNYSGHISVTSGQTLVQSGPYRIIRHPAYAGYLLMALGISLGYSSLAGLASLMVILLPGLVYRINIEEKLLIQRFGDAYRQYMRRTRRMLPGIW